jgi:cupin fold WbuC family metalloprotein
MEKIQNKEGSLVAIKIGSVSQGTVPITETEEPLQVLSLKHEKGYLVAPHKHHPHKRETSHLQECLIVLHGKLRIHFFDESTKEEIKYLDLVPGEACITISGPHSVEFLEDSNVLEIKNGPFIEDKRLL